MTSRRTLSNWYIWARMVVSVAGLVAALAEHASAPWFFGLFVAMWLVPFALGFRKDTQP